MSYEIKISVQDSFVIHSKIQYNDENDLDIIQKSLNIISANVQSITSPDAWID